MLGLSLSSATYSLGLINYASLLSGLQVPYVVGLSEETHGRDLSYTRYMVTLNNYWYPIAQFNAATPRKTHTTQHTGTHAHRFINLISYS